LLDLQSHNLRYQRYRFCAKILIWNTVSFSFIAEFIGCEYMSEKSIPEQLRNYMDFISKLPIMAHSIDDRGSSQKYACLEICDSGCGIPLEIQSKIFDPFFTTKAQGKGTGLGLAVVDAIIRKHDGLISWESSQKKGTVFQVYLPIVDSIDSTVIPPNNFEVKGHERIFLVDDESILLGLFKRSFERFGYQVTCFSDSLKALIFFQNNSDSYDMIITDMTMPNLTGLNLIEEILTIRPEIKSILCKGYSEFVTKDTAQSFGVNAYMEKPIKPRELAQKIREVFDHG